MPSAFDTGPVAVVTFEVGIVLFVIDFRLVVRINVNKHMCYYLGFSRLHDTQAAFDK